LGFAVTAVLAVLGLGAAAEGLGPRFHDNRRCCQLSTFRSAELALAETLGLRRYHAEIGQDKWVLERVFPHVSDGYFVDVGSGHGWIGTNSAALERRGWSGLCVEPFPVHMDGRTCTLAREVVFSESGRELDFHVAGGLSGLADTLGAWNTDGARAPTVRLRTTTLAELLARVGAPPFIHFISLDIEGAELEALRGFPFDRYRVGAWTIEHNREEPKRSTIRTLLMHHGYVRVHTWQQDDYYVAQSLAY
jgi:FkbM family methyltransferase